MITIKSDNEIEYMRTGGKLLAEVKQIIFDKMDIGVSLLSLDKIANQEIKKRGAKPSFLGYQDFPATACISVNDQLIHGIPSNYKIKDGDIVKVDLGLIYKGLHLDSAFTKGIGNISDQDKKIIAVAKDSFYKGVDAIKKGCRVGDIASAIGDYVKKNNLYVPKEFTGHGIGYNLHEDPGIPNEGKKGTGPLLRDNMVICIEPMILQGNNEVIFDDDGWTIWSGTKKNTAHYEHTIAIINGQPEILTGGI